MNINKKFLSLFLVLAMSFSFLASAEAKETDQVLSVVPIIITVDLPGLSNVAFKNFGTQNIGVSGGRRVIVLYDGGQCAAGQGNCHFSVAALRRVKDQQAGIDISGLTLLNDLIANPPVILDNAGNPFVNLTIDSLSIVEAATVKGYAIPPTDPDTTESLIRIFTRKLNNVRAIERDQDSEIV